MTRQTYPDSPAFNIAFCTRIYSEVDVPRLRNAFQSFIDRHAILRTTYITKDGLPVQQISGYSPVDFRQVNAADWDEEMLHSSVVTDLQQPFDLVTGPLFRARLFTQSPQNHVLLLANHHIAADGWSMWLLLDELRQLYVGTSVPRSESSYIDYVRWENDFIDGPEGERSWSYWQNKLKGDLPVLRLAEKDRLGIPVVDGRSLSFTLAEDLSQAIKRLAQREGATLYMMLISAFFTLLYRYTGQTDILIASPAANRTRPEFATIVGNFVNMFVLRIDLSGSPTFRNLLALVRKDVLASLENQNYPLSLLTQKLRRKRSSSESTFFQVDFALQKPQQTSDLVLLFGSTGEQKRINFAGMDMEFYDVPQQEGQLPLTLDMIEGDRRISGVFRYDRNRLTDATVKDMAEHFQVLLQTIVANPDFPIDQLRLISESEQEKLLAFSQTKADPRPHVCVHTIIETQADLVPDRIAVTHHGQSLTYAELNQRANRLARHLQTLGVGPEVRVGIHLNKSLDLIIAVLAVWKAGGTYVPLDPAYPIERLAYMLSDASVSLLLTTSCQVEHLPIGDWQVVIMDLMFDRLLSYADDDLPTNTTPDKLAYIIYTSGSTGKPKGVMVEHHNLTSIYFAWESAYDLCHIQHHLQMASFSFDVFAGDFMRALCSGGHLILCDRDTLLMPDQLYELLSHERIEAAEFVPAVLRALVDYLEKQGQKLDFMKLLICGSDSWTVEEYRRFRKICGSQTRLINSFGLSETTIDSSYYESTLEDLTGEGIVPIGRPFPGTSLYVLDTHCQLVPIGIVGELYVGGEGVARGYWNRPDLTTERFIDGPFSERLYRTGDLARWLADGNLEYLGRADLQIKLRGHRIEPSEIEGQIESYPGIRQAIVTLNENASGISRLVAYIVGDEPLDVTDLRTTLKSSLPDFMVPSAFVQVDTFPLTPNNKIDRRALPEPDQQESVLSSKLAAPETPMQQIIADTWCSVLGIERIGIYDNFFDLGGHSLMVVQVITRLQETVNVRVNPFYFQVENLAQIAFRYEEMAAAQTTQSSEVVQAESRNLIGRLFRRRSG